MSMEHLPSLEALHARCRECGECWEWKTEGKTEHVRRYPRIHIGGAFRYARRVLFEVARGRPPQPGRSVVPDCGNPYCHNPAHQVELTERQKCQRAAAQGSFSNPTRSAAIAKTQRQQRAKLTVEAVRAIRDSDESGAVLAARLGVHRSLISAVRRGKSWKDYANPFAGLMGL